MVEESTDNQTPPEVDVELVGNALKLLADDVEFISRGSADDLMCPIAWNHRESGGQQLCCLRALLHRGELDFVQADFATSNRLRAIWNTIQLLKYGEDYDQPDCYEGPLFLPGEVHPDGTFCRIDDLPHDLMTMMPSNVRSQLALDGKKDKWAWLPTVLRKLNSLLHGELDSNGGLSHLSPHEEAEGSPTDLPQVDIKLCQIIYDGECHQVSGDVAILFEHLVNNYPNPINGSKLSSKLSRTKGLIPDSLKPLVKSEPAKGTRLILPD